MMFESKIKIINYHDELINNVDVSFENFFLNSKNQTNEKMHHHQNIIQKIKEVQKYNLNSIDNNYKYCFFFEKIDKLVDNFKARKDRFYNFIINDNDRYLSEPKFGLLLIINEMISTDVNEKLKDLLNNCEKYEIMDYRKFDSLEKITKVGIIHELMIDKFDHPIIDLTNSTETVLKRIETTFINQDLNEKQLDFVPYYLNIKKIQELECNSDTSLCLEKIPSGFFKNFKFITRLTFNCCIIKKLSAHNFDCLENLKLLAIFHCSTKSIEPNAFYGLNKLQELHITDSYLIDLEPEVFYGLDDLIFLNLDANLLEKIRQNNFVHLKNLRHLKLSTNCIENLENGCFNGLDNLKILRLSYNKRCVVLDPEIFNPISNLEVLYLNNMELEQINAEVFKYLKKLKFMDFSFNCVNDASILNNLNNLEVLNLLSYDSLINIEKLKLRNLKFLALNQCENFRLRPELKKLQVLIINNFFGFETNFFQNLENLDFIIIRSEELSAIEKLNLQDFAFAKKLKYLKIELENSSKIMLENKVDYFKNLFDSDQKIEHNIKTYYSSLIFEIKTCQSVDQYLKENLKLSNDFLGHVYEII